MNDIAVVFKYSALESYSPKQLKRHRELNPELSDRMQTAHDDHSRSLDALTRLLRELGVDADFHERDGLGQSLDHYRFVISLGGDGTFINASHYAEKTLLIGVNSSPDNSVGHYCRFELKTRKGDLSLRRQLEAMLAGSVYPVKERQFVRMHVAVQDRPAPFPVLNDVLFAEQNPAATSRYTLRYRGRLHHQKSSGMWISTPSGSSAAYSSAGGREFKRAELRFVVRELYSDDRRRLTQGTIRTGEKLHIICSMMHGMLYLDGSHQRVSVALGEHVALSLHPKPLRAIW